MIQIVRRGMDSWEVTNAAEVELGGGLKGHVYSLLGRVVRGADGMWRAEVPQWQDIGHAWHPLDGSKPRLLREAAVRDLTSRKERAA